MAGEFCRYGRWFASRVRDRLKTIELDPARDNFFGFDTNSLEALDFLKERGVFTIVDQVDPDQVHEQIVMEEAERWPGWQKLPGRMPRSYWDRRRAEWHSASLVLVNSDWSRQAILQRGVPDEKIIVVPLAIDISDHKLPPPIEPRGRLKVLWLGNILIGKGIQYLVEAARLLERQDIEFLLAGPVGIEDDKVRAFPDNMKLLGRVTRDKLTEVYRQAHVFVLPTISDGFAVTQLEAMAHGLPVVTTPNCGRVVTDGVEGVIVPARDSRSLADALARLNSNRGLLREMSHNALITIRQYDLRSNARLIQNFALSARSRLGFPAPVP
jgi:glycosyltransferase involved in cell wall biosynthesis